MVSKHSIDLLEGTFFKQFSKRQILVLPGNVAYIDLFERECIDRTNPFEKVTFFGRNR